MGIRYQSSNKPPIVPNTSVKVPIVKFAPEPKRLIKPQIKEVLPAQAPIIEEQRIGAGAAKQAISIRLDTRILEHYKAGGPGWQSRINADLLEIAQKK